MLDRAFSKGLVAATGPVVKHQGALMSYSIYGADRSTHLKIVVIALVASIGMAGFGISAHFKAGDQYFRTAHVVKAGKPSMRFAAALAARQDTLSDLAFSNGSPAPSGTQIK
jgi:hypothetical protein